MMMMRMSGKRRDGKRQRDSAGKVDEGRRESTFKIMLRCRAGGNDVHMGGLRRKWNQVRKEDEGEE